MSKGRIRVERENLKLQDELHDLRAKINIAVDALEYVVAEANIHTVQETNVAKSALSAIRENERLCEECKGVGPHWHSEMPAQEKKG